MAALLAASGLSVGSAMGHDSLLSAAPAQLTFSLWSGPSSGTSFTLPESSVSLFWTEGEAGPTGATTRGFGLSRGEPRAQWVVAEPLQPAPPPGNVLRGVRNSSRPFGTKFLRGTAIITGVELAGAAVLALLPRQATKWDENAFDRGASNFKRAWSEVPVWDSDGTFHNFMGHPYAGAIYYNMIRSQGGTVWQSAGFALFESLMWEYVVEAAAEQPSIQDLIVTPIAGSFLGELFHRWSVAILRKGRLNFGQQALVVFLNPSYVINNGFRPPE